MTMGSAPTPEREWMPSAKRAWEERATPEVIGIRLRPVFVAALVHAEREPNQRCGGLLVGACSGREVGVGSLAAAFILDKRGPAAGQVRWTQGELSKGVLAAVHEDCLQVWETIEKHGRFEDMDTE